MNSKSCINLIGLFLGTLFFAQASYGEGMYFGGNIALSDITLNSISAKEKYPGFVTGMGYKIYGGKRINEHISIEAFYANSSDSKKYKIGDLDGVSGDILNFLNDVVYFGILDPGVYATVNMDVDYYGVNAKFSNRLSRLVSIYLKAGVSQWKSKIKISVSGQPNVSNTENGTGTNYGVGIKFHFNDSLSMHIDSEKYNFNDIEIMMIGIGAEVLF